MKKRDIYISVLAILFFAILLSQDEIARYAWQKYRNASAAIFLTRDAKLAMSIGNYYFNGGAYDLDKAEFAYRAAVFLEPKILWGHYQLARIYFVKGDKENALEEINKELAANPYNLRSLYVRGLIYGYWPDLPKAEEDFRRFTKWAPKEWAGYNDLAWILAKEGKYEEVEKTIQTALEEVPQADKNPWLLNSLGVAQLNLKKYGDAKKTFETTQILAKNLTLTEWSRAYPGNNSVETANGLKAFRRAVDFNLGKSRIELK